MSAHIYSLNRYLAYLITYQDVAVAAIVAVGVKHYFKMLSIFYQMLRTLQNVEYFLGKRISKLQELAMFQQVLTTIYQLCD